MQISENSSHLETLKRFCMEIFKFFEFDFERTTTKSTIIVYISLDFLLWQTFLFIAIEQLNTASDTFVFIAGSFLLQLTKLVIGLSKSVVGAAIIKTCGSSRQAVPRGLIRRFTRPQKIVTQATPSGSNFWFRDLLWIRLISNRTSCSTIGGVIVFVI